MFRVSTADHVSRHRPAVWNNGPAGRAGDAAMALIGALASFALRLTRAETSVFLLVVMFSNGGNYGLPVVSFAFGEEALSYGTVFFLTGSVLTNTVGAFLAAAGKRSLRMALMSVLRMPALYGIAAAILTLSSGAAVPTPLMRPITMMSDAALPLMILVLGMQLERAVAPSRPALVAVAVGISLVSAHSWARTHVFIGVWTRTASRGRARIDAGRHRTTILASNRLLSGFVTCGFPSTLPQPATLTPLLLISVTNRRPARVTRRVRHGRLRKPRTTNGKRGEIWAFPDPLCCHHRPHRLTHRFGQTASSIRLRRLPRHRSRLQSLRQQRRPSRLPRLPPCLRPRRNPLRRIRLSRKIRASSRCSFWCC